MFHEYRCRIVCPSPYYVVFGNIEVYLLTFHKGQIANFLKWNATETFCQYFAINMRQAFQFKTLKGPFRDLIILNI